MMASFSTPRKRTRVKGAGHTLPGLFPASSAHSSPDDNDDDD